MYVLHCEINRLFWDNKQADTLLLIGRMTLMCMHHLKLVMPIPLLLLMTVWFPC